MFSSLSSRAQVLRLKVFVLGILERYGFKNPKLKLLSHGYNTFFRVDANSQKFALRLGVNSLRSLGNVSAELAWLQALTRDTDLIVPKPVATLDEKLIVSQEMDGIARAIHCVLFEWLSGSDVLEINSRATLWSVLDASPHNFITTPRVLNCPQIANCLTCETSFLLK
jgi:hypothetical protein